MSYISMPSFRALFIQGKLRSAKKEQALFALTCIVFYDALQSIIGCVAATLNLRILKCTSWAGHNLMATDSEHQFTSQHLFFSYLD